MVLGGAERTVGAATQTSYPKGSKYLPGEPVAHNYGLLETNNVLLWGIVADYFQLLGCPGNYRVLRVWG